MPTKQKELPDISRTISENGKAPESRLQTAWQVWHICNELEDGDSKRAKKRSRIYKAYNRFPPTDYSTLVKLKRGDSSNVNWGMLAFVVDNNAASFFDMLTERTRAYEIETKYGDPKERKEWSDYISDAFDRAIRRWDDFLINQEQCILDMGLYGKGVEIWEDTGWQSCHISADDLLVPDSLKITMRNLHEFGYKKKYTLLELWEKIKDEETAEKMGWNRSAVINAIRFQREDWHQNKTQEQWLHDVNEGNITLSSSMKEYVDVYVLLAKEYDCKISKFIVLRSYAVPIRNTQKKEEKIAINNEGFLYKKIGFADSISDVVAPFFDSTGSGKWHDTPSIAEKIFVQCRQYDVVMNAMMDAIKINMTLILQGQTADASEKLKEIVFNPITLIPSDIPVIQQRIALPTQEASMTLQQMMGDMYRGIGNYRVHEKGSGGEALTATQSQLDAAEAAKLTGIQLKRFSGQHSFYGRPLYRKFVSTSVGEEGYEIFREFKERLNDAGVPKEAWAWENIESIESNMLAGAGSPSYKLMASEKTIELTNIAPRDDGQSNAIDDALAALHGRSNVRRYRMKKDNDPTMEQRIIGFENEAMANPTSNPENVQVHPSDNHLEHVKSHMNNEARIIVLVNQKIDDGSITEEFARDSMQQLVMTGGHVNTHLQYLMRDKTKQNELKAIVQSMGEIQKGADQLGQKLAEMFKAKQEEQGDVEKDPKIKREIALSQIQVDTAQKIATISANALAQKHQQRMEQDQEAAANRIAIERANAIKPAEKEKPKENK